MHFKHLAVPKILRSLKCDKDSAFCFQILALLAVGVHLGCYKFMSSMAGGGIDLNMESGMAE